MDDDYYRIKNSYRNKILPQLFQTPAAPFLKDFSLICEKKEMQAHKLVLAMYSKFFEDIFIKSPKLNYYNFLPDISFEDLEVFLEYVYTGMLTFRRSRLYPLMKLFYYLQVRGFVDLGDGVPDYEALIADSLQNSGNVQSRENLDSSANAGLNYQPSKNDDHQASTAVVDKVHEDNDHQASTAVVDKVHEDNDHQESLLPAATVVQGVYYMLDANHQDLVLVPLPVDRIHNISYPSAPELETKQQWEMARPCGEQAECKGDVDSQMPISSCPSKSDVTSGQQVCNSVSANMECLFCESRQPSKLIKVGSEGRKLLIKEWHQIDDKVYKKLLKKKEVYLHGECKRKHLNSKSPKKSPKPIKIKCSEDFDSDSDSPASRTSPTCQSLKPQWQMPDPVKKKMIPVQDATDPQSCCSSFKAKKCMFCQDQHGKLLKMRFKTREKFLNEICKNDAEMCDILTNAVNVYYHSPCVQVYQHSHSRRKSKNTEEEANKKLKK